MSRIRLKIKMELLEDLLLSSGHGLAGVEHTGPRLDRDGRPFMPGTTLKGLLRESIENYLCWTGSPNSSHITNLFAGADAGSSFQHRLVFDRLKLDNASTDWATGRKRLYLKNGVIRGKVSISCVAAGQCFYGSILCDEADRPLVEKGLKGIHWAGTMRSRGMGRVRFSVYGTSVLPQAQPIPKSHWIHYRLRLDTPMIISWMERSGRQTGHGSYTESRNYLPGSAVRGMVMGTLSQQQPEQFQHFRHALLNSVQFGCALPTADGEELIPTPRGFYADKQGTCFYSVLDQDVHPGHKRAELGSFCRIEDGVLHHYSPAMEQRIRVSRRSSNTNTGRAISAGTVLAGYIYLHDPALAPLVASAFSGQVQFGAGRYTGSGQCTLLSLDTQMPAYFCYGYGPEDPIGKELYMMLLSGCTMSRHGESGGIDLQALAVLLGVPEVVIHRCATSVMDSGGYNSTWKASMPTSVMYSPGSIFKLSFPQDPPAWETLQWLQQTGLGLRTVEGFGQVLFLKDFSHIRQSRRTSSLPKDRQKTAQQRAARCAWLLDTPLPGKVSGSVLDELRNIGRSLISGEAQAAERLHSYLGSIDSMHIRKRVTRRETFAAIQQVLNQPVSQTLDCPGYPDSFEERVQLLTDWIEVNRRKGY